MDTQFSYLEAIRQAVMYPVLDVFDSRNDENYILSNINILVNAADIYKSMTGGYSKMLDYLNDVDDKYMRHFLMIMASYMPDDQFDEMVYNMFLANRFNYSEAYMFLQYYYALTLIKDGKSDYVLPALKSILPAEWWDEITGTLPFEARQRDDLIWDYKEAEDYAEKEDDYEYFVKELEKNEETKEDVSNRLSAYESRAEEIKNAVKVDQTPAETKEEEPANPVTESILDRLPVAPVTMEEAEDILVEEPAPEPDAETMHEYEEVEEPAEKTFEQVVENATNHAEPVPQPIQTVEPEQKPFADPAVDAKNDFLDLLNGIKGA